MHLIFVFLFVGGCTIRGTLSFDYPSSGWTPKPILPTLNSCEIGAPCTVDLAVDTYCGGVGVCEYIKWTSSTYVFNYL